MQVFLGKSDNKENNRPGSPCLLKKSCLDPTLCSTPKANSKTNESPASSCSKVDTGNCSLDSDDVNVIESSSPNAEHIAEILPEGISNGSSLEEVNDLGEYQGIKNQHHHVIILLCLLFTCFGSLLVIFLG